MARIGAENARSHAHISPLDLLDGLGRPTEEVLLDGLADEDVGARVLLVLGVVVAAAVLEGGVEEVAVDVVVGVDGLGGQVVVVEVGVGVAVDVGREEDAGEGVGDAQARVLGVVHDHLHGLEDAGKKATRFGAVVLDEKVEVALLVGGEVGGLADLAEALEIVRFH